jgi:hypothetical protein
MGVNSFLLSPRRIEYDYTIIGLGMHTGDERIGLTPLPREQGGARFLYPLPDFVFWI